MRRPRGSLTLLLTLVLVTSGCLGGGVVDRFAPTSTTEETPQDPTSIATASYPRCQHPWPCGHGSEWPAGLSGPFEAASIGRVNVTSSDGTRLHGWIMRPAVPDGVRVPVLLGSTPYEGQVGPKPGDAGFGEHSAEVFGVNLSLMAEHGYAVAIFNVRGTGNSEGCVDFYGPKEQRDQVRLVNWLGNRTWSNGRVAMMGLSHRAGTVWQAAVHAPEPLKTTITAGIITNPYTLFHTPQGAPTAPWATGDEQSLSVATTGPPLPPLQGPSRRTTTEWLGVAPSRVCPTPARMMVNVNTGVYTDERDRSFWEPRRIIDDVPNVTAATLLTHGFHDSRTAAFQESAVWSLLTDSTPKHMLQGQWSHDFPNTNEYRPGWTLDGWNERVVGWLDFWLKGLGDPPATLGTVGYQNDHGAWHSTTAWPPADARDEVLHLTPEGLSTAPADGALSFRSAPDPASSILAHRTVGFRGGERPGPLCAVGNQGAGSGSFVSYVSDPLEAAAVVAGNPHAYLNITSSEPGGLVHVTVLDLGPDFRCDARGIPQNATWITQGTADLRFHDGGYSGKDFPVGTPTHVRVDLKDDAVILEPGHRLGVWVSYGDPVHTTSQPYHPLLTIHGDSEVVLPVVDATLGGHAPAHTYPPRPFVPRG